MKKRDLVEEAIALLDGDFTDERTKRRREHATRKYAEFLAREHEREAQRDLSLRILDIGFKVLAKELHPDVGGSHERVARLNRARDHLKRMA